MMGGGPRTVPRGLNKWQWKRLHEKKLHEKANIVLEQEKQVYLARIRSDVRAKLVSAESPLTGSRKIHLKESSYDPLSTKDHIRTLTVRFMKIGAEDHWNEADGPSDTTFPSSRAARNGSTGDSIDVKTLILGKSIFSPSMSRKSVFSTSMSCNLNKPRCYWTCTRWTYDMVSDFGHEYIRNKVTEFTSTCGSRRGTLKAVSCVLNFSRYYSLGPVSATRKRLNFKKGGDSMSKSSSDFKASLGYGRRLKSPKFRIKETDSSSDDESDEYGSEEELKTGDHTRRIVGSSAALGNYDKKIRKQVPLNFVEDEYDVSQQVEAIRKDITLRSEHEEARKEVKEEIVLSSKRFDECSVSPLTVRSLNEAGYMQMTTVQDATLCAVLEGKDALVRARAGTGKSIAFLLPAIETVLKATCGSQTWRGPPIYVLILCPTRELASQTCAEARVLLKHHSDIGVQTLVGGTRFKVDQKCLESHPCQIIVATPGRLLDHIENKSSISLRLMGLQMLILDEADHLLDLGFRKDVEKIVDCLPRKRQTLLFSATIPKEVRRISQLVLKRESTYIDTVGIGSLEIHDKVKQHYLIAPHDQHLHLVHHLLRSHVCQVLEYKVIVFCATAAMTSLLFSLFRDLKLNVREIHSKKPSVYQTRISNEFKESKGMVLVTSDVSARGMNYPDVTLVIQVGIPVDRRQYIHRLGRTGRLGKEGEGFLLLAPWEEFFLNDLQDLPIEKLPLPPLDPDIKIKIDNSIEKIDFSLKEAAYHSWLGYYNSIKAIGRDKTTLVEMANQFAASIGLQKTPALFRKTALKMGLKGVSGIRIRK